MDVTEEAADHQDQNSKAPLSEDQLLKKETWRHWMNIFSDGQKVSE